MSTIVSIDVRLFHIPLAEVLVDAKHGDHHIFELITENLSNPSGRNRCRWVVCAFSTSFEGGYLNGGSDEVWELG